MSRPSRSRQRSDVAGSSAGPSLRFPGDPQPVSGQRRGRAIRAGHRAVRRSRLAASSRSRSIVGQPGRAVPPGSGGRPRPGRPPRARRRTRPACPGRTVPAAHRHGGTTAPVPANRRPARAPSPFRHRPPTHTPRSPRSGQASWPARLAPTWPHRLGSTGGPGRRPAGRCRTRRPGQPRSRQAGTAPDATVTSPPAGSISSNWSPSPGSTQTASRPTARPCGPSAAGQLAQTCGVRSRSSTRTSTGYSQSVHQSAPNPVVSKLGSQHRLRTLIRCHRSRVWLAYRCAGGLPVRVRRRAARDGGRAGTRAAPRDPCLPAGPAGHRPDDPRARRSGAALTRYGNAPGGRGAGPHGGPPVTRGVPPSGQARPSGSAGLPGPASRPVPAGCGRPDWPGCRTGSGTGRCPAPGPAPARHQGRPRAWPLARWHARSRAPGRPRPNAARTTAPEQQATVPPALARRADRRTRRAAAGSRAAAG